MITIGIDQSFRKTGFVVLKDTKMIHHEIISSDKDDDIILQARTISNQIAFLVGQFNPDHIGLEGLSFSSRGNQTRNLGGLQFIILNELRYNMNRSVEIVNINTLKKFATGNGKAKKEEMISCLPDEILEIANMIPKSKGRDDFADAYHIANYLHKVYEDIK